MSDVKVSVSQSKSSTPTPAKKGGNIISSVAPLVCIFLGYIIWRFIIGNPDNFTKPDSTGAWFWPTHEGPKSGFSKMYLGGIIVPILIVCFLKVLRL